MGRKNPYGMPGLVKRASERPFSYIVHVPKRIRSLVNGSIHYPWNGEALLVQGQANIIVHLGTHDEDVAKHRCSDIRPAVDFLIKRAEKLLTAGPSHAPYAHDVEAKIMAAQLESDILAADDDAVLGLNRHAPITEIIEGLITRDGRSACRWLASRVAQDVERRKVEFDLVSVARSNGHYRGPADFYDQPETGSDFSLDTTLEVNLRAVVDGAPLTDDLQAAVRQAVGVQPVASCCFPNDVDDRLAENGLTMKTGPDRRHVALELLRSEVRARRIVHSRRTGDATATPTRPPLLNACSGRTKDVPVKP